MKIDIILEPDVTPEQMAELAVTAENLGIRALWSSNYHQNWDSLTLEATPSGLIYPFNEPV